MRVTQNSAETRFTVIDVQEASGCIRFDLTTTSHLLSCGDIPSIRIILGSHRWGLIRTTSGSWLCHEHTTNLGTGVSRLPVLDCGTTFHPGFGGRDSPSILLDDLWKHIFLATEAPSDFFEL